jgi:hypothetical protein
MDELFIFDYAVFCGHRIVGIQNNYQARLKGVVGD